MNTVIKWPMMNLISMLKGLLFFSLVFLKTVQASCQFKPNIKFVSLSAPVTYLLEQLNLIHAPQLVGISDFHQLAQDYDQHKRINGGEFISQQLVNSWTEHIVLYDQSHRLSQILARNSQLQAIEVSTRDLNWEQSFQLVQTKILPYLTVECVDQMARMQVRFSQTLNQIKATRNKPLHVVFFVGECQREVMPKMIMLQDGVLKDLISIGQVKTLDSPLAYLMWSEKDLAEFKNRQNPLYICLHPSPKMQFLNGEQAHIWNFHHPHILNPGFPQLEAFLSLFNQLKIKNL